MAAPALDDNLRLSEAVEDLPVQLLVAELGIEALTVTVLPGGPQLDVGGRRADGDDPFPHRLCDELRAIACWE